MRNMYISSDIEQYTVAKETAQDGLLLTNNKSIAKNESFYYYSSLLPKSQTHLTDVISTTP